MKKDNYLPSLDGIRAICIVLVLGDHAPYGDGFPSDWKNLWGYFFNGQLGVLSFFVLSGFLITHLLMREEEKNEHISLRSFYFRRVIRIFPVYYFFLLVVTVLDYITALDLSTCNYLTAIAYVKNFGCMSWIEGHLWSLSVEEQFYLLWPLILVFFQKKWRWYFAIGLILIAPFFRVLFYTLDQGNLVQFSFMTNMDSLMIGCLTALLLKHYSAKVKTIISWHPTWSRSLAIVLIYFVWALKKNLVLGYFTVPLGYTLQSLSVAYLIISYVFIQKGIGYRLLNLSYIRHLGILSYSIYVWQQPFFENAETFGFDSLLILTFPFNIFAAITVAIVSYHFLEKPFLKLRKRYRNSRKSEELKKVKVKPDLQTAPI